MAVAALTRVFDVQPCFLEKEGLRSCAWDSLGISVQLESIFGAACHQQPAGHIALYVPSHPGIGANYP